METGGKKLFFLGFKTALAYAVFITSFFSLSILNEFKDGGAFSDVINQKKQAMIGETAIKIGIADSKSERVKGLSGREELPPYEGLFFVFEEDGYNNMWMKDMNFSIDIIWFNESKEVVYFEEGVSPKTYPKTFGPDKKTRYVLEMPAGFVSENYILLGDQITIL